MSPYPTRRPDLQTQDAAVAEMDRQAAEQDFIQQQQEEQRRMQQMQEEQARDAARAQKAALANAKRQGVKIAPDSTGAETIQRHEDGQPVYEAGFVGQPQITDKGGAVAYRDARGQRYDVPFDAIRSEPDPTGETFYSFDVMAPDGTKQTMRQPAGTKPLFRVDPGTGSRIVDVTDPATGSVQPRVVGVDPLVANKAAVEKRKNAAQLAQNERSGEAEKLRLQLDEREVFFQPVRDKLKVAQDAADKLAKEKITYAQKDGDEKTRGMYQVTELTDGSTMDRKLTQPEEIAKAGAWINNRTATEKALMDAKAEHDPAAAEIQSLKERRATLARESHSESLRAQAEIRRMEEAAKKGSDVTKPDWQQRAESLRSNTRVQSLNAVADLEESGDPLAPDVQRAAMPDAAASINRMMSGMLNNGLDLLNAGLGAGGKGTLERIIADSPAMTNRTGKPATTDETRRIAAKSLGITDPASVEVTPNPLGHLELRYGDQEFASYEPDRNRITIMQTAGGLHERAADLIANADKDGVPVYLSNTYPNKAEQPFTAAELRDLLVQGVDAVRTADSQDTAEAALAQAGLAPNDIRGMVRSGKLSVQDGRMMLDKLHGFEAVNYSRPAIEQELGRVLATSKTAKADWEAGNKAAVINRVLDGVASKATSGVVVDRGILEQRRQELLSQHVKEPFSLWSSRWAFGVSPKELIIPMAGMWAAMPRTVLHEVTGGAFTTESQELSNRDWNDYQKRVVGFVDKMQNRDKVLSGVEKLRAWAKTANPNDQPPDELAEELAGIVYNEYHELTDDAAKALNTSRDTFNVNRDPMLRAALQSYLKTANPAAFGQLTGLMMMDAQDRKTQAAMLAYVENPRVASAGDVIGRAKGLAINLTPDQAGALIGISRVLNRTEDPKAQQKLIADAGKIMGLEGQEAAETLVRVTADETDDPDSAWGLLKGGFSAGKQEVVIEAATMAAEAGLAWVTAGAATPEIIAERVARQGIKTGIRAAIRRNAQAAFTKLADSSTAFAKTAAALGKARQTVGTGLANMGEAFAKAGIKPATFGQPLTRADKVRNAAAQVGKNAAAAAPMESLEEGVAVIGEPDPNAASIGEQMLMGAAGGLVLTPMFAGAAAVGQAWKNRGAGAEWEAKKTGYVEELNRRMEAVPGFKPLTVADFDAWQGLQDNPAHTQARAAYQSALATFEQELALHQDAAAGNAILPVTPELLAARVQLDSAAKELELATSSAFMAMDELRGIPEAERPLYTAAAKAATGARDFTEAEAKALMAQGGNNAVAFQQAETGSPNQPQFREQKISGQVGGKSFTGSQQLQNITNAPAVSNVAPGVYRLPAGVRVDVPPALLDSLVQKAPTMVDLLRQPANQTPAVQAVVAKVDAKKQATTKAGKTAPATPAETQAAAELSAQAPAMKALPKVAKKRSKLLATLKGKGVVVRVVNNTAEAEAILGRKVAKGRKGVTQSVNGVPHVVLIGEQSVDAMADTLDHEAIHGLSLAFAAENPELHAAAMLAVDPASPEFDAALNDFMRREYNGYDKLSPSQKFEEALRAIVEGRWKGRTSAKSKGFKKFLKAFLAYVRGLMDGSQNAALKQIVANIETALQNEPNNQTRVQPQQSGGQNMPQPGNVPVVPVQPPAQAPTQGANPATLPPEQAAERRAQILAKENANAATPPDPAQVAAVLYDLRSAETGAALDLDEIELALDNAERRLQKGKPMDWPVDRTWLPNVSTASVPALKELLGSSEGIAAMRLRIDELKQDTSLNKPAQAPTQGANPAGGVKASLPQDLKGAKPRYNYGQKSFELEFQSDLDKAAFIAAQDTPSKRDADYVAWAMQQTGLDEPAIRQRGKAIRDYIKGKAAESPSGTILLIPDQQSSKGSTVGEASPSNQFPDTGEKVLPAKAIEKVTREAIGRIAAKSPRIKALLKESKKAHSYHSGGMWLEPDGKVSFHVPTIVQQLESFGVTDNATAGKRVEALLDEEIRHSANMEAARRLFAGEQAAGRVLRGMSFETWRDAWYGDIWNSHFTDAMRQAVQEAYGDTLPEAEWMLAMEGLRMLDQLRATGSITEAVLLALDAILESLREFLDLVTAGGKKVVEAEIMAIREVLAEYGYEGGTVKPDAKKKPAKKKPAKAKAQKQDAPKTPKSSTQLTLSPADAKPILDFGATIPKNELFDSMDPEWSDGTLETEPHVTVLYGLTKHESAPVAKAIKDHGPVTVTLGKLSIFENDQYDVLKVDVEGPELRALNAKLTKLPHESSFPDYKPHMTIAYLKKGEGKKYVGDTRFEGQTITFNTMTFSPPSELRGELGKPELPLEVPETAPDAKPGSPASDGAVDGAQSTVREYRDVYGKRWFIADSEWQSDKTKLRAFEDEAGTRRTFIVRDNIVTAESTGEKADLVRRIEAAGYQLPAEQFRETESQKGWRQRWEQGWRPYGLNEDGQIVPAWEEVNGQLRLTDMVNFLWAKTPVQEPVSPPATISPEAKSEQGAAPASNSVPVSEQYMNEINRLLRKKKAAMIAGNGDLVDSLEDQIEQLRATVPMPTQAPASANEQDEAISLEELGDELHALGAGENTWMKARSPRGPKGTSTDDMPSRQDIEDLAKKRLTDDEWQKLSQDYEDGREVRGSIIATEAAPASAKVVTPEMIASKVEELLRAPTKTTKKPAVAFGSQTEERAFKSGFEAATQKQGKMPPPEKTGLSPKDRKWDDAWRKGWASGQTFVRSLPDTPATAEAKVEEQVQVVAATEGQRDAKEIKKEIAEKLDAAIAAALENESPRAKEIRKEIKEQEIIHKETTSTSSSRNLTKQIGRLQKELDRETRSNAVITIQIPGDGTFKVFNNVETLRNIRKRVSLIETDITPDAPSSEAVNRKQDALNLADSASERFGGPLAAIEWLKEQMADSTDSVKEWYQSAIDLLSKRKGDIAREEAEQSTPESESTSTAGVDESALNTPMMKQWRILREPLDANTVLLVRLGDFYEAFGNDAKVLSELAKVALTKRNGIPMAGIPHHSATGYIQKLVSAGKRVAIAETVGDIKPGMATERKVTSITPEPTPAAPAEEVPESPEMAAEPKSPADLIRQHLDADDAASALAVFDGMTKDEINKTALAVFGRGFYNNTKAEMLTALKQWLPDSTKSVMTALAKQSAIASAKRALKTAKENQDRHAEGILGMPTTEQAFQSVSDEEGKDPHGIGKEAVAKAWQKEVDDAQAKVDELEAESAAPAVEETAPEVASIKSTRKPRAPKKPTLFERLQAYFVPGAIVDSYGGKDRVIALYPDGGIVQGGWSVEVVSVDKDGKDTPGARVRRHSTLPSEKDLQKAWENRPVVEDLTQTPSGIADFGQKLGGARKDKAAPTMPRDRAEAIVRNLTPKEQAGKLNPKEREAIDEARMSLASAPAAQNAEPSPGGLSKAEVKTNYGNGFYRAADGDETNNIYITDEKEDAERYLSSERKVRKYKSYWTRKELDLLSMASTFAKIEAASGVPREQYSTFPFEELNRAEVRNGLWGNGYDSVVFWDKHSDNSTDHLSVLIRSSEQFKPQKHPAAQNAEPSPGGLSEAEFARLPEKEQESILRSDDVAKARAVLHAGLALPTNDQYTHLTFEDEPSKSSKSDSLYYFVKAWLTDSETDRLFKKDEYGFLEYDYELEDAGYQIDDAGVYKGLEIRISDHPSTASARTDADIELIVDDGRSSRSSWYQKHPDAYRSFANAAADIPSRVVKELRIKQQTPTVASGGSVPVGTPALRQGADQNLREDESFFSPVNPESSRAAGGTLASSPARSVTAAQDAEYMAAVEAGDMEKAQRMVDEAARAAGYNSETLFRGRQDTGNVVSFGKDGAHFTPDREYAEGYAEGEFGNVVSGKAKIIKPLRIDLALIESDSFETFKAHLSNQGLLPSTPARLFEWSQNPKYNQTKTIGEAIDAIESDSNWADFQEDPSSSFTDNLGSAIWPLGFDAIRTLEHGNRELPVVILKSPSQIKSADPVTRNAAGNVIPLSQRFNPQSDSILRSAPAPKKPNRATQAMRDIIEGLPPPHREVLRDLLVNGMSIEDAATTHGISETAVGHILRRGEAHIRLMMDRAPTKPTVQVQDGIVKATSGRPDRALAGNAVIAAATQRQPTIEEVTHAEMQELARRLFDVAPTDAETLVRRYLDSNGTDMRDSDLSPEVQSIMREAHTRNAAPMLMQAAGQLYTIRKTTDGTGNTHDLVRLAWSWTDTGTAAGRALGMRRDPFDTPEERSAYYLQEALLTPPESIRNQLRRNPANRDRILAAWAKRADEIKAEMLAHGIDLDATFADHAEEQKLVEETIPEPVKPVLARAPKKTRQLVKALLQGMTPSEAIKAAGLSAKAAFKAYQDFRASLNQTGTEAAQAMRDQLLRSAPAPGADFAANLGLPDLTEAEWLEAVQTDKPLRTTTETEKLKQHREKAKKAGTLDLKNPVSTRKAVRAIEERKSNAFEKISEFWRASILSGPQTHVVNIVSGLTYGTYEASFKKLAAGAQADIARMFGAKPDAASLADIPAMIAASLPSIKLAFLDGIAAWKSETRVFENYALQLRDDNGELFKEQFNPALKGTLGKVMRGISFRLMGAADEFVKSFFTRIEVAAQARQIARNEGKTGLELAQAIQELMEPGSLAWERALGQAKKITFQTEIGSGSEAIDAIDGLARAISRTKKGDFGKPLKGLAHFTFPFVDTPTNIFKAGVTMSPVGGLLALVDMVRAYQRYHKGNAEEAAKIYNAARALDDLTNQIVAWGFILGLSELVKPGDDDEELPFITGTIPWRSTSPGERELAYRTAPPQSIRIGDRWISYKRLDPFASALAFTVDAIREFQSGKPIDEVWGRIALGVGRHMQDKTFLQGVSDIVNAVQDPERFGTKWVTNIATGFIPNLIRQPIRTADDVFREMDLPNDLGFWDALGRRMGYGIYPQGAMPAFTVWGEPARKDTGTGGPNTDWMLRLLSPADMRAANVDMLDVALLRYNATHQDGDPRSLFGVTAPSRELQRTIGGQVIKISLDDAEYEDFIAKAGKAARQAIGTTYEGRDLTEQDVDRIKDILSRAHKTFSNAAFVQAVQKRGGLNALANTTK